jgi:hypothetical protein
LLEALTRALCDLECVRLPNRDEAMHLLELKQAIRLKLPMLKIRLTL